VGSLLKIKVGIYIDDEGNMVPFTKARATKAIHEELIKKLRKRGSLPVVPWIYTW